MPSWDEVFQAVADRDGRAQLLVEPPAPVESLKPQCPVCHDWHSAYALFPPACDYPGNPYVIFVDSAEARARRARVLAEIETNAHHAVLRLTERKEG